MPLIKNARYKQFLKTGFIETLDRSVFDKLLARVEHPKDKQQARALMILLYITGRRPSEILELRGGVCHQGQESLEAANKDPERRKVHDPFPAAFKSLDSRILGLREKQV